MQGIVENGQIHLEGDVRLPERTKVWVVIPGMELEGVSQALTPHLADRRQAIDFQLEVIEKTAVQFDLSPLEEEWLLQQLTDRKEL